ncbi:porin [Vibrio marisflavi]|uniref:Outer membrane protein U n=1 Tax=Vibrio marisflavi CECT 7928 TaxID=634439 RepID=A0ABM9A3R0_9VIBR|nr:porin [Vibrio marisflavi]CAH0538732.1 Outer membrane protein U [Vibrio marisflavi CECT 7928]
MKKTLIALAVSAATLAFGANADTLATAQANDGNLAGTSLYSANGNDIIMNGRVEARAQEQGGKVSDASRVRLGFGGISTINADNNLYGVGYWQGEFTTDDNGNVDSNSNSLTTRYQYAGIGGDFGQVVYGKDDGAFETFMDGYTDIMQTFGGNYKVLGVANRSDNTATYQGSYGNFSAIANYRFADDTTSTNATDNTSNGQRGTSAAVNYTIGDTGASIGTGYSNQNGSHTYMTGAGYTISNFYVGASYTDGKLDFDNYTAFQTSNPYSFSGKQDYREYEIAASYTLGKTAFTTNYSNEKTGDYTSAKAIAVDATYYFTPNFRSYIGYNFNLMNSGDQVNGVALNKTGAQDQAMVGMRYDF